MNDVIPFYLVNRLGPYGHYRLLVLVVLALFTLSNPCTWIAIRLNSLLSVTLFEATEGVASTRLEADADTNRATSPRQHRLVWRPRRGPAETIRPSA